MTDWQAAIAAYAVLFLVAETEAAPLAAALAWMASVGYVFYHAGQLRWAGLLPGSSKPGGT